MSITPSTLPRSVNLVHVRAPHVERGKLAALRLPLSRLARLAEPAAWRAAVLASMIAPDSPRERSTWFDAVGQGWEAQQLLDDLSELTRAHRLPWFEHFARLLAPGPVAARQELLATARRLMIADGVVTSFDQLRWIALRHLLAGSAVSPPAGAPTDLEVMGDEAAQMACVFSAFLSEFMPAAQVTLDLGGGAPANEEWYDAVIAPWSDRRDVHGAPVPLPRRTGHDIDAVLRALRGLQALPWLMRPVLVRHWYDAARVLTEGPQLHAEAADALRLACVLLDSPVPEDLARQYNEVAPPRH